MKYSIYPKILKKTIDIIYPRRCPVCDRPVRPFGALICPECEKEPVRVGLCTCRKCGKPVNDGVEYCHDCTVGRHEYNRGCSVFTYRSVSGGVFRFKYEGRAEYAEYFGREMAKRLKEELVLTKADRLIPVPVSDERKRKRGYNQALLLADVISKETGIPVLENVLYRVKDTAAMKAMSTRERQKNLQSTFFVYGNDVKLNRIILVDDIYTTGTTIDACSKRLKEAGAGSVFFVTLAIGDERDD